MRRLPLNLSALLRGPLLLGAALGALPCLAPPDPTRVEAVLVWSNSAAERARVEEYARGLPGAIGDERLVGQVQWGDHSWVHVIEIGVPSVEGLIRRFPGPDNGALPFQGILAHGVAVPRPPRLRAEGLTEMAVNLSRAGLIEGISLLASYHRFLKVDCGLADVRALSEASRDALAREAGKIIRGLSAIVDLWREASTQRMRLLIRSPAGRARFPGIEHQDEDAVIHSALTSANAEAALADYERLVRAATELLDVLDTPFARRTAVLLANATGGSPLYVLLSEANAEKYLAVWYELAEQMFPVAETNISAVPFPLGYSQALRLSALAEGDDTGSLALYHAGPALPVLNLVRRLRFDEPVEALVAFLLKSERSLTHLLGPSMGMVQGLVIVDKTLDELAQGERFLSWGADRQRVYALAALACFERALSRAKTEGLKVILIDRALLLVETLERALPAVRNSKAVTDAKALLASAVTKAETEVSASFAFDCMGRVTRGGWVPSPDGKP